MEIPAEYLFEDEEKVKVVVSSGTKQGIALGLGPEL